MAEPVEVRASELIEFIHTPGPVVVFVSVHPEHPFNAALPRRMREATPRDVTFGTTGLLDLVVSGSPALSVLKQGLFACAVSTRLEALPGYYLFRDGRMMAWDSGLPTGADLTMIARGALPGLVVFAITKDLGILATAVRLASDEATAIRLTDRFQQAFESPHQGARPPPRRASEQDLARAYAVLGVTPNATDAEVDRAWRARRVAWHPDRAVGDAVEFARRNRLAVEINRARDLIREHRAFGGS